MSEKVRIAVEVPRDLRQKLKTALSAEGTDMAKWIAEQASKKVASYQDKLRSELVQQ